MTLYSPTSYKIIILTLDNWCNIAYICENLHSVYKDQKQKSYFSMLILSQLLRNSETNICGEVAFHTNQY